MCRSAADGGRRCPAHTPDARALDYRARLVVASDDPGVHAAALASDEPKLVAAGAGAIDDHDTVTHLADQAGLAGAAVLDGTVEETRAAAADPDTGYRVLRVMMQHSDPETRYRAIQSLDAQGEIGETERRWVEHHDDPHMATAYWRGPDAALQAAEWDAEDAERAAERLRQEEADREYDDRKAREQARVERRRAAADRRHRDAIRRDVIAMHGPEGWARWQRAEEERQRRAAHSGIALWIDEDGQPQSGTREDLDAFLDARRAREDAIARGLAANPLTPDEAVEILRADADATTARRADAQAHHRGLRALWSRIVPKRRRKM